MSEHLTPEVPVVRAVRATPVLRGPPTGDTRTWAYWRSDSLHSTSGTRSTPGGRATSSSAPSAAPTRRPSSRTATGCASCTTTDFDPTCGNKVLGPIDDLREDPDTPVGVVPLFDTAYNRDLLPGLRAGVYGSSMRMRVVEETWNDEPDPSDYNPKGLPERTISRVKVMEFGPVTFPANPDATAGMRSLTDTFYDRLKQRDTSAYDDAVRAAGRTPDLAGRPSTRRAGGGDHDAEPSSGTAPAMSPDDPRTRDRVLRALGASVADKPTRTPTILGYSKSGAPIWLVQGGDGRDDDKPTRSYTLDDLDGRRPEEIRDIIDHTKAQIKELHQGEDGELRSSTTRAERPQGAPRCPRARRGHVRGAPEDPGVLPHAEGDRVLAARRQARRPVRRRPPADLREARDRALRRWTTVRDCAPGRRPEGPHRAADPPGLRHRPPRPGHRERGVPGRVAEARHPPTRSSRGGAPGGQCLGGIPGDVGGNHHQRVDSVSRCSSTPRSS
jgi:hypothetical protein